MTRALLLALTLTAYAPPMSDYYRCRQAADRDACLTIYGGKPL